MVISHTDMKVFRVELILGNEEKVGPCSQNMCFTASSP